MVRSAARGSGRSAAEILPECRRLLKPKLPSHLRSNERSNQHQCSLLIIVSTAEPYRRTSSQPLFKPTLYNSKSPKPLLISSAGSGWRDPDWRIPSFRRRPEIELRGVLRDDPSFYPSIYPSTYHLSICPSICLSIYLSVSTDLYSAYVYIYAYVYIGFSQWDIRKEWVKGIKAHELLVFHSARFCEVG